MQRLKSLSKVAILLAFTVNVYSAAADEDNFEEVLTAIKEAPARGLMGLTATLDAEHVLITDTDDPPTELGRIRRDRWGDFVRTSITDVGLRDYASVQDDNDQTLILLAFARSESTVQLANAEVKLTERFWSRMDVPAEYSGDRETGKQHAVILVHDPHSAVTARFHLIDGIRALIEANPDKRFAFLVEGSYVTETEKIPTDIVASALVQGVPHEAQVFHLLNGTWIDVPLAYRLLYPVPAVDALAIDDQKLVKEDIEQRRAVEGALEGESLVTGLRELAKLRSDMIEENSAANDPLVKLLEIVLFNSASPTNEDRSRFRRAAIAADDLAQQLEKQRGVASPEKVKILRQLASRDRSYDLAMRRNAAMEQKIRDYTKKNPDTIPIAFIGSFHTDDLIRSLRDDFDYMVVEPYEIHKVTQDEYKQFDEMLIGRKVRQPKPANDANVTEHKIWVSPPKEDMPRVRQDLIGFGRTFDVRKRQIEQSGVKSTRSSDATIAVEKLSYTRKEKIRVADEKELAKVNDGAFGDFGPLHTTKVDEPVWYMPPDSPKWQSQLDFMEAALARPPVWWQPEPGLKAAKLLPAGDGTISDLALYEGKTDAVRFYEGEAASKQLALIIALPPFKAESKARIHFQRLSIDTQNKRQEKDDG